jgi:hypothetical protein
MFEPDKSVTVFPEIVELSKLQRNMRPLGSCDDDGDVVFPEDVEAGACELTEAAPAIMAEIVVVPLVRTTARPDGEIVATEGAEEIQVTLVVRSRVLPSLNWPVAVNCCEPPTGAVREDGETLIDTSIVAALAVGEFQPIRARNIIAPKTCCQARS